MSNLPSITLPLRVADKRIRRSVLAGKSLAGLKYDFEGRQGVDKRKDFPMLQPFEPSLEESTFAGAGARGSLGRVILPEISLSFLLAVDRGKSRMFARAETDRRGLLDWALYVMDAICTDDEGALDCSLDGSCIKAPSFRMDDGGSEINQLSWQTTLDITFYPTPVCAGSYTIPRE